jgi:delta-aminolevulinic acid dehydratase/porphobilinogen synthase
MTDVVLSSLTRDVIAKVRKETQQPVDVYGLCGSYRTVVGIIKKNFHGFYMDLCIPHPQ